MHMSTTQNVLGRLQQSVVNPVVRMAWDLDDDDPAERVRILSEANFPRRLCMSTSKALHTNPLTIRVDLDDK
jgi:hypothetical protein